MEEEVNAMREDTTRQAPQLPESHDNRLGGWLPDDELTQEWQRAVEDYRRECDEEDRRRILGERPC
jgi:hypothetical protein